MKEKTKKILKGVGLGLGSIAILALGVGIGACSVKNGLTQPITTTPIRKGLSERPRNSPIVGDTDNLFNTDNSIPDVYFYDYYAKPAQNLDTYLVHLDEGLYYIKATGTSGESIPYINSFSNSIDELNAFGEYVAQFDWGTTKYFDDYNPKPNPSPKGWITSGYFYVSSEYPVVSFSLSYYNSIYITLVDTLEVPAENVVNFPSNWSPMALISDNLSVKGGYAFVDVSPATYQTLVPINVSFKQNLFRYDGKVYDEMVFTFVDLSHGDGYIQDDGQPWKPWEKTTAELSSSIHVFGLYSLRFNSTFSGDSIVALSPIYSDTPFQTGGDGTYYPPTVYLPTGEYRWVNPKVTYVEFIDTSFGSGSNRYNGRYSDYTDLNLLIYLNGYLSEGNYLAIGASGGVFEIFTNAFNSVIPLLSVQVLPSISLGILLFLPLIGGIIVVIIRVIKK